MSSHGRRTDEGRTRFPLTSVPAAAVTPLRWALGERVTGADGTTLVETWEHRDTNRSLAVFEVTRRAVVLRVRTPAGRVQYFGAETATVEPALAALDGYDAWRRSGAAA